MNKEGANANKIPESGASPSQELYDRIAADLHIQSTRQRRRYAYRSLVRRRYYSKRIGTALVVGALVLVCALAYLVPVTISNLRTDESDEKTRVFFTLDREALVKDIYAQLDDTPVSIGQEGGYYFVDVSKNGILVLQTEMVTGARTQTDVVIDSVDETPPSIASHGKKGDSILIYLADGEEGSGVDFAAITAYEPDTGAAVEPLYYDEAEGLVAFAYPERTVRITIPDKAGNAISAILEPYVLKS